MKFGLEELNSDQDLSMLNEIFNFTQFNTNTRQTVVDYIYKGRRISIGLPPLARHQ